MATVSNRHCSQKCTYHTSSKHVQ